MVALIPLGIANADDRALVEHAMRNTEALEPETLHTPGCVGAAFRVHPWMKRSLGKGSETGAADRAATLYGVMLQNMLMLRKIAISPISISIRIWISAPSNGWFQCAYTAAYRGRRVAIIERRILRDLAGGAGHATAWENTIRSSSP